MEPREGLLLLSAIHDLGHFRKLCRAHLDLPEATRLQRKIFGYASDGLGSAEFIVGYGAILDVFSRSPDGLSVCRLGLYACM